MSIHIELQKESQLNEYPSSVHATDNNFYITTPQSIVSINPECVIKQPTPICSFLPLQEVHDYFLSLKFHPITMYQNNQITQRLLIQKPNTELYYEAVEMSFFQQQLFIGGKRFLNSWDLQKNKLIQIQKKIMVSCLKVNDQGIFYGSFDKNIYLQEDQSQEKKIFKAHVGGVQQILIKENYLYSGIFLIKGARWDDYIYQWDIRNEKNFVQCFNRGQNRTNQRLFFDIYDKKLMFGDNNSWVIFDTHSQKRQQFQMNGKVMGVKLSKNGIIVAMGDRKYPVIGYDSEQSYSEEEDRGQWGYCIYSYLE